MPLLPQHQQAGRGGVDAVARFQAWLRTADRAASTVRTYTTAAGEFVAFLDTRGGMARCDGGAVEAFVATSAGYQFKTVEQKLCALRVGAENSVTSCDLHVLVYQTPESVSS